MDRNSRRSEPRRNVFRMSLNSPPREYGVSSRQDGYQTYTTQSNSATKSNSVTKNQYKINKDDSGASMGEESVERVLHGGENTVLNETPL